jgi:hypothetical protein
VTFQHVSTTSLSLPQLVLAALLGRFVADRLGRVDMQLGVAFSGQQEDFWLDQ